MSATVTNAYTGIGTRAEYFNFQADVPTIVHAGDGTDYVFAYNGSDLIFGEGGRDYINALGGDDVIFGDYGTNDINGVVPTGFTQAGAGDIIRAGGGNDVVFGGAGRDYINGESGNDYLDGGVDGDVIYGGFGSDQLYGRDGDDILWGGSPAATSGAGTYPSFGPLFAGSTITLNYNGLNDTLIAPFEAGNSFGEASPNDASDDILDGGAGNDLLDGGAGADILVGGTGTDTANYLGATGTVNINLTSGTGLGAEAAGDVLSGIEDVNGSAFGDLLRGDAEANTLFGAGGGDVLIGEGGNDVLVGGTGGDVLNGGAGNDAFFFRNETGTDTITDFDQSGDDVLIFSGFSTSVTVNDLTFTAINGGADTLVTAANWQGSVVLQNTTFSVIGQDDFLFV